MIASRFAVSVLVVLGFLVGCDKKTSQGSGTPAEPATAAATGSGGATASSVGGVGNGSITGKVTFVGTAPKPKVLNMAAVPQCAHLHTDPVLDDSIVIGPQGELKNVVVYVTDGGTLGGSLPTTPVVLDQKGCIYVPHVAVVMVGQDFKARNSDGFLHNVHGLCRDNPEFNIPQTQAGQINDIPANKTPEMFSIKCDVHPWMNAWVVVLDHPFSAITGDDGTFTIKGLKDGKYLLTARHQKLGKAEAVVELKNGKAVSDFKIGLKK